MQIQKISTADIEKAKQQARTRSQYKEAFEQAQTSPIKISGLTLGQAWGIRKTSTKHQLTALVRKENGTYSVYLYREKKQ